jgi:hypothetical protein
MNRWVLAAACSIAGLLLLAACATDDDNPFPQHSANADEPVPGAATPPPQSSSAGWKW